MLHTCTPTQKISLTPSNAFVRQQHGGKRGTHWRHFHCQHQCLRLAAAWWRWRHSLKSGSSPTPMPSFGGSIVANGTLIEVIFNTTHFCCYKSKLAFNACLPNLRSSFCQHKKIAEFHFLFRFKQLNSIFCSSHINFLPLHISNSKMWLWQTL